VDRAKCPERGPRARTAGGQAVRVDDADARRGLRLRWYAEEVGALCRRVLVLFALLAAVLLAVNVFCVGASPLHAATGESMPEALASTALGLGIVLAWPLLLLALAWLLRWPELLRTAGLAALAATTGRGLAVWAGHLLAARAAGVPPAERGLWVLADPVDWAFVIAGVLLCARAWRLAGEARQILPPEAQAASTARKAWARGLFVATNLYAVALLGFAGTASFEGSSHLLQPGVDPRREHQALRALNEGADQANRGQLALAEASFLRSLKLWEELTTGRPAPAAYRANLATTLNDLGWVCHKQGRTKEAEAYYARAVAEADRLAGAPDVEDGFRRTMDGARQALAGLRDEKTEKTLQEKDQTAWRKYEEAQVKAEREPAEAEGLYQEAVALWEEVLPQATSPDYRKAALARLATAHLVLGELRQQLDRRPQAEAAFKKAAEYGEKAVALDPERPLPRHNLEVARQALEGLAEEAFQAEVARLCEAERFADAFDLCLRGIAELEAPPRPGQDPGAARRRLAARLKHFAWLAAHCPDDRVRDTRAAVKHARRAAELQPDVADYWYTLATAQYRNGDWRESLESLGKVRSQQGEWAAEDWFLAAMARHQLRQKDEARAALRKGVEWMEEQQRKAEGNTLLRIRYEMRRPGLEGMRREAEGLIRGNDPADRGVG
jgi:tetratricopeptide (TPR) repeat protein